MAWWIDRRDYGWWMINGLMGGWIYWLGGWIGGRVPGWMDG